MALDRFGVVPALIEWDTNLPELAVLLDEAASAERLVQASQSRERHVVSA